MSKLLIIVFLFPFNVYAWTNTEKVLETGYIAALIIDVGQTHNIINRRSEGYYETNKLLGKYPRKRSVNLGATAYAIGHFYISNKLTKHRKLWQTSTLLLQLNNIHHNKTIGLHVNF